jgi:hypothetical protein
MRYSDEKKEEYWGHFLKLKNYWQYRVTLRRLEKIKPIIWNDSDFWWDILLRHSGCDKTPEEMLEENKEIYEHCFGNFAGMVYESLITNRIIKIK